MAPVLLRVVPLAVAAAMAPLPIILAIALLETKLPVANSIGKKGGRQNSSP